MVTLGSGAGEGDRFSGVTMYSDGSNLTLTLGVFTPLVFYKYKVKYDDLTCNYEVVCC